jgi:predicted O-methyltransferase YrrM
MNKIWRIVEFLKFYFKAKTLYNIHSPFLFELLKYISDVDKRYYQFDKIEQVRTFHINNHNTLNINDQGAGSSIKNGQARTIASICKVSTSGEKKCRLIYNIIQYLKPQSVVELGTNLGIATAYIQIASKNENVHTIEADAQLMDIAQQTFTRLKLPIITYNTTFETFFRDYPEIIIDADLVYIDGNHTYEGTILAYREATISQTKQKVLIFDDIYWSKGMQRAWKDICLDITSGYCIDLYIIGIVILNVNIDHCENVKFIPWKYKPFSNGLLG